MPTHVRSRDKLTYKAKPMKYEDIGQLHLIVSHACYAVDKTKIRMLDKLTKPVIVKRSFSTLLKPHVAVFCGAKDS